MIMRNKRGGGHGMGQPDEGCVDSSPTPSRYRVTMATPPPLAGPRVQRPHPGLSAGDTLSPLDWAVYFAADWLRPGETVPSSEGGMGVGKGRSTRVAGFKMAPASLDDVEERPWARPSVLEKRGAELGLARRVEGAAVGLWRWC